MRQLDLGNNNIKSNNQAPIPVNRDFRRKQSNYKTDHSLKLISLSGFFPFFPYLTIFLFILSFFGPQVTLIFVYVVKLMHQPKWSMFWYGQCFGVVNVHMWVMFEVLQEMPLAGALNVSPWSIRKCHICKCPNTGK